MAGATTDNTACDDTLPGHAWRDHSALCPRGARRQRRRAINRVCWVEHRCQRRAGTQVFKQVSASRESHFSGIKEGAQTLPLSGHAPAPLSRLRRPPPRDGAPHGCLPIALISSRE